ncbi:oligosaccharide flippase family protein, partial [Klebsiella pneumoniae]|uniref:oligosaccharide flippase family protein n=1 Tax=Klebsiella pneumoniae TaxID=573 RepID=UPI001BAE0C75
HFSLASVSSNLRFGAWLTADSIINYVNTNLSTLVLVRLLGGNLAGVHNLAYRGAADPPIKINPRNSRVPFDAGANCKR